MHPYTIQGLQKKMWDIYEAKELTAQSKEES